MTRSPPTDTDLTACVRQSHWRRHGGAGICWRVSRHIARISGTTVALSLIVGTAAAQETFFTVACDAGLGAAFTFILTGLALYVIFKGMVDAILGLDKRRSKGSSSRQKQGREGIKSGVTKIFGGIFAPPLLIGLINAMGVSLECLSPGLLV